LAPIIFLTTQPTNVAQTNRFLTRYNLRQGSWPWRTEAVFVSLLGLENNFKKDPGYTDGSQEKQTAGEDAHREAE
jgi:hypothetical protein